MVARVLLLVAATILVIIIAYLVGHAITEFCVEHGLGCR